MATAVALSLIALAWALVAAPRGYGEGDASELTLALALGGAPHPTGYPLYTLAGHAATAWLHSLGVAWPVAANAWSALGSAVAIFFLHRLGAAMAGERLPSRGTERRLLATIPLVPLLTQPIWSAAATTAEVTSWQAAWSLGAAWTAWRLAGDSTSHGAGAGAPLRSLQARLFLWGGVIGLGLAHHATSALLATPLTIWVIARLRGASPSAGPSGAPSRPGGGSFALSLAAGMALPLLSWGWIAYRASHPAAFQWPLLEPGLGGLIAHLTGRAYGGYLGGFHPSPADARLLASSIPWLALLLIALAVTLAASPRGPRRTFATAVGAALLAQGAFVLAYRVPDPSSHLVPILALGAIVLPDLAARIRARAGGAVAALAAAALLLALLPAWIGADLAAKAHAEETDRLVRDAWRRVPFERGLVVWNNDLYARLRAYQILEGSRPALLVEHPGVLTWPGPRRRFQEAHGFDPWNGATPTSDAMLAQLPDLAARAGGLPAIDFDVLLREAGAGDEGTSR
ncbi:MAG TPA: DUF2723 domain-containing protein [Candidatus Eisenbacteria bacterium]|nr:DUF2723 domain-containing protein [Candidatus Eisenbacteria bacterium]